MSKTGMGFGAGLAALVMAAPAAAATIHVNTTQDNPAVDGSCSLREAIVASNLQSTVDTCVASSGANTIVLPAGTYSIKPSLGAIGVTSYISLEGKGYKKVVIQQDPSQATSDSAGVFIVNLAGTLNINSVSFTKFRGRVLTVNGSGASASLSYTKMYNNLGNFFSSGTCIANIGNLYISDSELSECEGTGGGAIFNKGSLSIVASTLVRNHSERGGAILNSTGGNLYINSSTIGNNLSNVYGGAIQNGGNAYIYSSTIAYNRTDPLNHSDSCTNGDQRCSAVQNLSGAYMELSGTVVAHNVTGANQTKPNCIGLPASLGGNLLGESADKACAVTTLPGAIANVSPQNAGLHNSSGDPLWYGGVGRTYMPTTTSPLLNKLAASSQPCAEADQRGIRRWQRPCDVGAVERSPALLVVGNLTLSSGDSVLKFLLENLGFAVTVELSTSTTSASANNKGLVVISESVASADVNTKFRDVFTGVMVLESALFDDMRMTGTTMNTHYGASSDFGMILQPGVITSKYGAQGFLTTTTSTVSYSWGVPNVSSSREAALNSSSSKYGLFAYSPGGVMFPDTQFAPGYRVGAFATDVAMGNLSAQGGELLREAMLFAAR